jgi:hypothetical protein
VLPKSQACRSASLPAHARALQEIAMQLPCYLEAAQATLHPTPPYHHPHTLSTRPSLSPNAVYLDCAAPDLPFACPLHIHVTSAAIWDAFQLSTHLHAAAPWPVGSGSTSAACFQSHPRAQTGRGCRHGYQSSRALPRQQGSQRHQHHLQMVPQTDTPAPQHTELVSIKRAHGRSSEATWHVATLSLSARSYLLLLPTCFCSLCIL